VAYNAESRVVTAAGATYTYDGNGLCVQKVSAGTTTVYIFSGSKVIAEYANGAVPSAPTREYIYAAAQLVATLAGATTNYHHADHLSARVNTDSTGAVVGQQGHFPFGESWYNTSTTTKWQFTTYERDAESGNDYAMARYHVNRLARFSSPDPVAGSLGNPQSLNRYVYVLNNPLNLVDPLGNDPCGGGECLMMDVDNWGPQMLGGQQPWDEVLAWYLAAVADAFAQARGGRGDSSGLNGAINQARLMLSNPDCANFLKGVLTNLGYAPNLDSFLKEFDHLTIIPTPAGDAKSDPGFPSFRTTAHIAYGPGQSSTVHVDAPRAADLVPTLFHETFHDTLYGVGDPRLAAAATGDNSYLTASQKAASRAASREFDKHCTPK